MISASVLRFLRDRLGPARATSGEDSSVRILQGVKLYRDVRVGQRLFRGSRDGESRPIDYVLDVLPEHGLTGKSVLDLGTAGGAVCFEAVRRGCERAVGVEIADSRIRGAKLIKRITGVPNVEFIQGDFYAFLGHRVRQFDVIFVLNVLHHLANPFPLLRRICRASREHVVLETPDDVSAERYSEYSADLSDVEGARSPRTFGDIARFLAIQNFRIEQHRPSSADARFFRNAESERSLYLFGRESRLKGREERWNEMQLYRGAREESYARARADEFNLDLRPTDDLTDILRAEFRRDWDEATLNFLLAGPRASGKSHYFDLAGPECRPRYNPKIFKFPNADGQHGLRRHLHPRRGEGRRFASALISSADDEDAHCTTPEIVRALRGRPVVCLLLNVDFEQHFDRLYQREVETFGESSVDFDVSLRFDCTRVITALRKSGVRYRVFTTPREPR